MNLSRQFKIRASAAGQIMTNDRSGKGMGKTAQSYVETWVKEQLYNRRRQFTSKYTTKGIEMESAAIEYLSEAWRLGMVFKNEVWRENEHFTGTPDLILPDRGIDIKCAWDCFTFPLFASELPEKDYFYQGQVYMDLFNRNRWDFVYILMDTPDEIVERELFYKTRDADLTPEDIQQLEASYQYSHLPESLRIKSFRVERDDAIIQSIRDRVEQCRQYIEQL
mgnify:CR=1 FL=1|jgi:hypothetical protein